MAVATPDVGKMPIRLRLAAIVAVVAAVIVLGGSIAFDASLAGGIRATIERSLVRRAGRVEADISAHTLPLATGGAGSSTVVLQPDQSLVQVIGPAGNLEYTTEVAGALPLVNGAGLHEARNHLVWIEASRAVWKNAHLLLVKTFTLGSEQTVVVGASMDQMNDSLSRLHDALFIGGPLLILLAAAGAWVLTRGALRPVEHLRAQAEAISDAGLGTRLTDPRTHDELSALAVTLNALLERLYASQSQQRGFVAAASHELRTPLAALKAELELACGPGKSVESFQETLDVVNHRVEDMIYLSEQLLTLAQGEELTQGMTQEHRGELPMQSAVQLLEPLIAESLSAYQASAARKGIDLLLDAEPDIACMVDGMGFRRVVENLLDNAIRYAPANSFVEVGLHRHYSSESGDMAVFEVIDHGQGIPESFLPKAFDLFTRADPSRGAAGDGLKGSGLGLAIVRMFVKRFGGFAGITNLPNGGTRVFVQLPLADGTPEVSEREGSTSQKLSGQVMSAESAGQADEKNEGERPFAMNE